VRELKAYEAEYPGLNHVLIRWPEGLPLDRFKHQLDLFAHEVMPHFGKTESQVPAVAPSLGD
jgi:hypothetical protein